MHDARLDRVLSLEAAVREYLEHLAVLAEHVGLELGDPVGVGDKPEMLEQRRGDTVPLELVEHRERNFRAAWIGANDITADADEALAPILNHRRGQPDMIFEVELGETLQIVGRQVAPNPHEPKIN